MVTSLLIQNRSLPNPVLFKGLGYSVVIPGRAVDFTCQIPTENALEDIRVLLNDVPSLEIMILEDGEGIPIPPPVPDPPILSYIGNYTPVVLRDEDYKGVWDATSGSAPHSAPEAGWYWRVSVSGNYNLDGVDEWTKGDFAKWTGTLWMKAVGLAGYKSIYEILATIDTDASLAMNLDTRIPSQKAVKTYIDSIVLGLLDDRGTYNASGNTFPATGGSGPSGTVKKGDLWYISVAGTLGGVAVTSGDTVRALTDAPGQTPSNWSILENCIGYTPENAANKDTDVALAADSDVKYPSQKAIKAYADGKVSHSLAEEENDFLVASGIGAWVKKTLSEVKTMLGLGTAAYTPSTDYAPAAHVGAGGAAHANAVAAGAAGFMTGSDKTKLDGVAAGANAYVHPNHSGDVTSSGDGAQTIAAKAVTLAKMADMATASVIYRKTAGAGVPEVQTLAQLKTDLGLSGTNSGDSATPAETAATIGALINGADAKTAPVDADYLALMDSEASNVTKKLSWAYVKSVLKTYFDGLYNMYSHPTGDGNLHVPATSTTNTNKVLTAGATAGSFSWQTPSTDYAWAAHVGAGGAAHANAVAAGAAGFMTGSDKTKLDGVAAGANAYVHPNHSGDVTSSGDGAQTIAAKAVTLAKMADMATASVIYRKTAGAGVPEVQTLAQLKTDLGLSGTNSGDQTNVSGSSGSCTGNAATATGTQRLYRSDSPIDTYNVKSWWNTPVAGYWNLRGYNTDTYHAGCAVAYADTAGSAPANGGTATNLSGGTVAATTITATGNITAYYSDERLKDFFGYIPNALDKLLSLHGYYFKGNEKAKALGYDSDRLQVGLSAQEVEKVCPEIVTAAPIENDQGYKTLWYEKMAPYFVEAIKEQQRRFVEAISEQQRQIEELKVLVRELSK